ncbi:hypothetical protein CI109_103812 [Kwoniella shandongensis]|uniref:Uncharacterized protein n=1 Tax=Kwoniella shandongensis TaxID=1734106 RepID=A0A5M6C7G1_9TREE|nr:uncharacterized protein CI109_000494 [Kwoniella shandongensis]KAA5530923.1 hypothetical protein CI109_000494 [Kwoniella shandongensis]
MSDYQAILEEEFEVLESIFPDELEKLDDTSLQIRIEPDEPSSSHPLRLNLVVSYPPTYPDTIPDLSLEEIEDDEDEDDEDGGESGPNGELKEGEEEQILEQLRAVAEESLGMAMTFTIASAAKEALGVTISERIRKEKEEDDRRTRAYEEAEAARTRGTPLTPDAFNKWRKGFMAELKVRREKEEEERVRTMLAKEREEWKRRRDRLSGRQLFETSQTLATSDEGLYEEGAEEVDMRQYTREEREAERRLEEEEEEKRRRGLVFAADGE